LNSIAVLTPPTQPYSRESTSATQESKQHRGSRYWLAFAVTVVFIFVAGAASVYAPGQDHFASIPLHGDGSWYYNYELGYQIQDEDIFYHDIGHSIENVRKADIVFLGWSKVLFGIDWRAFDDFSQRHH
jgi:hypothetical protein